MTDSVGYILIYRTSFWERSERTRLRFPLLPNIEGCPFTGDSSKTQGLERGCSAFGLWRPALFQGRRQGSSAGRRLCAWSCNRQRRMGHAQFTYRRRQVTSTYKRSWQKLINSHSANTFELKMKAGQTIDWQCMVTFWNQVTTEWPLSMRCEIPWYFPALRLPMLRYHMLPVSHTRTVVLWGWRSKSMGNGKIWPPPPTPSPLTDCHQNLHRWLYRGRLSSCKISSRSDKGFRFCAWATSST